MTQPNLVGKKIPGIGRIVRVKKNKHGRNIYVIERADGRRKGHKGNVVNRMIQEAGFTS